MQTHPLQVVAAEPSPRSSPTATRVIDRAIDQWNKLPEEVVCANNIHKFKKKYDKTVLKDGTYELKSFL